MAHTFTVSDEQYEAMNEAAERQGLPTAEGLFRQWVESLTETPTFDDPDEFARWLGAPDDMIARAKQRAAELFAAEASERADV